MRQLYRLGILLPRADVAAMSDLTSWRWQRAFRVAHWPCRKTRTCFTLTHFLSKKRIVAFLTDISREQGPLPPEVSVLEVLLKAT